MATIRCKPPASQSVTQHGTGNDLAFALNPQSSPKERLVRQHALVEIAEHVRLSTGADGGAIALEESGAVVCLARSGECAPAVGAFLDQKSGLSGLCLRTGKLVRCDDTESDGRVDPLAARALQIRSVLAVPVRRDGRVIGLIEVLARTPHAFGSKEEETLQAATSDVLRGMDEATADDVPIRPPAGFAVQPALHETSTAGNGTDTEDRLRALFAFNATLTEPAAPSAALQEAVVQEDAAELAYDDAETEESAPVGTTTAEETAAEFVPVLAGFEAAQAESAASSNLRTVLAGVVGLALLVGIGLSAWRYTNGKASKRLPPVQASAASSQIEKLRSAAEQGDAAAQYDLAMRYLKGDGVARSESDATAWLLKSAHLGNNSAQLQIGVAYELGRGVPQDLVKAYACYVIAGVNGNRGSDAAQKALTPKLTMRQIAEARTLLGEMYQGGVGTPVDNVQAYVWFSLAQAAGSREGQRARAVLASKMSKEQIAVATERAAERLNRQSRAPR